MFCTKCGKEMPEGARFCTNCGKLLENDSHESEEVAEIPDRTEEIAVVEHDIPESISCKSCGTPLEEGMLACPNCGTGFVFDDESLDEYALVDKELVAADDDADSVSDADETDSVSEDASDDVTEPPLQAAPSKTVTNGNIGSNLKKIIVVVVCAVVLVCFAIVALLFTTCSTSEVTIDDPKFSDAAIRNAVAVQVDTDGDGVLSTEERGAVTGFSIINDEISFALDGATPKATNITGISSKKDSVQREVPLDLFPNLTTFVAPACGLTSLDLKSNGKMQYVDVRGNGLQSLDLAANKNLKALFCDDSVAIEGLDEKTFYYADLLVSAERTDEAASVETNAISVVYDTSGRPLRRVWGSDTKEYVYDEQGKLVRAGSSDDVRSMQTYVYENNGELREYIWSHSVHFEKDTVIEEGFTYDSQGRVLDETSKQGGLPQASGTFLYANDTTLNPSSFADESAGYSEEYSFDGRGYLTEVNRVMNGDQLATHIAYTASGAVSGIWSGDYGRLEVEFNREGDPVSALVEESAISLPRTEMTFTCNDDGYIVEIDSSCDSDSRIERTLSIGYVKMVGRYDDRPALRFAPSFKPMLNGMLLIHPVTTPLDKALFAGIGDFSYDPMIYGCSVYELGPEFVSLRNAGLFTEVLTNANERKLIEWDREHWKDGLALD